MCNKPKRCNSGSIVFINNYKYALHVEHFLSPNDAHNVKKRRVIKTF